MLKRIAKSLGAALMYFGIYLAWQFIVVFVGVFGISLYAGFQLGFDAAMNGTDIDAAIPDMTMFVMEQTMRSTLLMTVIAGVLTLLTYFIMFKVRKKKPLAEVGIHKMPVLHAICMFVLGIVMNPAVVFILSIIPFPESWITQYDMQSALITDADMWLVILTSVIVAPILEEVVFRGLVHTRLKKCMPMLAAMIISAWVFGFMHGAIIWVIYASLFGFLLAWVFEKYKSLLAPICLHFGFNLYGVLMSELGELPIYVYIAAIPLAIGGIIFVQLTSKNKIEFTMPKDTNSWLNTPEN